MRLLGTVLLALVVFDVLIVLTVAACRGAVRAWERHEERALVRELEAWRRYYRGGGAAGQPARRP